MNLDPSFKKLQVLEIRSGLKGLPKFFWFFFKLIFSAIFIVKVLLSLSFFFFAISLLFFLFVKDLEMWFF